MDEVDLWIGILDASRQGDLDRVRHFLSLGAHVDSPDIFSGYTPLHYAIESGNAALAAFLIERGADIAHANNTAQQTPLESAVLAGRADMAKILLQAGADPYVRVYPENQPLIEAAIQHEEGEIADLFRSYLANRKETGDPS